MLKDGDISKQAKINPAKLKPADEAQLLVAQPDGKFKAISINGDATLSSDGTLTVAGSGQAPVVERNPALDEPELAEGQIAVGGATRSERVNLGTGSNAIPQRDSSGNLKAETSDNADKLDNQEGAYYTNVDNHVYPTPTTTTSNGNSTTTTSSAPKVIEFVPNTSNYPCSFSHTFGYIPDVTVFKNNSGTYEMIDAQVTATSSNVTVNVSDPSISTRIVAK
jgi:hypothetical protein